MASMERAGTTPREDRHGPNSAGAHAGPSGRTPGVRGRRLIALTTGGVAVLLLALLLLPIGAHAAGPTAGAGYAVAHASAAQSVVANFTGNITFPSSSVVHKITYLTATTTRSVVGNMTGVILADEWGAVLPNGSMWVRGIGTFVGTILGTSPGVVQMIWFATGTYGGSLYGHVLLFHGQQGLAGVHGSGTASANFTGPTSFDGGYDLSLIVP